ncbi:MAG: aspartate carbamoyltransferase [Elusimicrobia bacterium CG1_02_37_114]|nr:MAG: aspartate carbamoyltransferase [Elusimicrobia bacterium CG1_02_37_114]PIV52475.1 MAG: aspartate carbamoyltransferase [Elusimicrobia bacterium CG02_land_8_20_14_3_00_37_13]PIZ12646.1 MAG: aspartate carbamoyltransferase [Elusimicrobia bacterium CG_4_10_14_0_8_um_filter_37_32]
MRLKNKDLLGLEYLSKEEIELILKTAVPFKELFTRSIKKVPTLRGKTVVLLFYEPSTRTRISFELAAKRLSADTVNISASGSSVEKGESLIDTGKTLEAMKADFVVIRHSMSGASHVLARNINPSVINAGDGSHEHPTQGLLDIFTINEKKGTVKGLKVVIIGDIAHSRVARSNIWGLTKLGAEVVVCGPSTLIPRDIEKTGAKVCYNLDFALKNADVVNVLRIQLERQKTKRLPSLREYNLLFGMTKEKLKLAKPDVIIMHPGPMNRGIEITSNVADGAQSVIDEQVTNGIAVRMAVLYLLAGGKSSPES